MNKWKKIFFIFSFLVISALYAQGAQAGVLPAPTIVQPTRSSVIVDRKPLITGLTITESRVLFYIDGVFNGQTAILKHPSGTANFAYRPFLNLSRGYHSLTVVALDAEGRKSRISRVDFEVQHPMPAPTMLKPVVNRKSVPARPFIVGLAKNESRILIYVDNKQQSNFLVKEHPSGTANFAFQPAANLKPGWHKIYAYAQNYQGKISIPSRPVYYLVAAKKPRIAQGASDQKTAPERIKDQVRKDAVVDVSEENGPKKIDDKALKIDIKRLEKDKVRNVNEPKDDDLEKILNEVNSQENASGTGQMDENRNSQSRLKLNIFIFVLFLVGIIVWIVWVNKEMIRERKNQNNTDTPPVPLPPESKTGRGRKDKDEADK